VLSKLPDAAVRILTEPATEEMPVFRDAKSSGVGHE